MRWLPIILTLVVSVGCIASHQSVVEDVDVEWWGETKSFEMSNVDTTTYRDIDIFVRYYPSEIAVDSICLQVDTTSPDSLYIRERVVMHLPTLHTSQSSSHIIARPYRRQVVWSKVGDYSVDITPVVSYKGVEAVGIDIVIVKSE